MKIGIIDYGAGNIQSVANALSSLEQKWGIVRRPEELGRFQKVIIPGQGAAGSAMQRLMESGLSEMIADLEIPFLGICLGMQILSEFSQEENTQCLWVIPGKVKKFEEDLKIPHIGWNQVQKAKDSPLWEGIQENPYFYFAHSYYFDVPASVVIGKTNYGLSFASMIQKKNFYGTQFHPEKSGAVGLQLLRNFCEKC